MTKLRYAKRLFDRKPLACHLYVTDRCNLDCQYCSEYDNRAPHPDLEDLKRWSRKARELGCFHIGLQGGEPLLYPHIVDVVRHCKEIGFTVSLSTNGFLLSADLARGLDDAGLDTLQISVDRMRPAASTKKALRSVATKLVHLAGCRFGVQIAGVLFADTVSECREVLEYSMARDIPAHFRLVHPDSKQNYRVPVGEKRHLEAFIDDMMARKAGGEKIHSTWAILDYQKGLLTGREADWTCTAGYKYFFISSQGKFWPCSMYRTDIDIMDVTSECLDSFYRKKTCQANCGVYCTVTASLACAHPVRFLIGELGIGRKTAQGGRGTDALPHQEPVVEPPLIA